MCIARFLCHVSLFYLSFNTPSRRTKTNPNKTVSGIEKDSKVNMKEFLIAILEDNLHDERTVGLSDADIIEVLEQSVEIMALTEEVSLQLSRLTNHSYVLDG